MTVTPAGDGEVRVAARGELDLAGAGRLEEALQAARAGRVPVVLDLSGLDFMDSTGVRLLLQAADTARAEGPPLRVVRPRAGDACRALEETGVMALLPVEGDWA